MAQITLPITLLDAYKSRVIDVDLVGEPFDDVQALMRLLSDSPSSFHIFVKVEGNEHPTALVADVNLEQLAEVRDILDTDDRGRVRFDNGGRGGDPMPTLIDIINVIGYVTTPYAVGKLAHKTWYELIYGRRQKAARDWLRGGRDDVLDPLRSWVRFQRAWKEDHFRKIFDLNRDEAFRLLRASGYEYRDTDETWWT